MKKTIANWILEGGELLGEQWKSIAFPADALDAFNQYKTKLNAKDNGVWAFIEIPLKERRLFIRAVNVSQYGQRAVTWYMGFVLKRADYQHADYRSLHHALLSLTSEELLQAAQSQKVLTVDVMPKPHGTPPSDVALKGTSFGEDWPDDYEAFCRTMNQPTTSQWFNKLGLAINPTELSSAFTKVFANKRPPAELPPNPTDPISSIVKMCSDCLNTLLEKAWFKPLLAALLFALGIILAASFFLLRQEPDDAEPSAPARTAQTEQTEQTEQSSEPQTNSVPDSIQEPSSPAPTPEPLQKTPEQPDNI